MATARVVSYTLVVTITHCDSDSTIDETLSQLFRPSAKISSKSFIAFHVIVVTQCSVKS